MKMFMEQLWKKIIREPTDVRNKQPVPAKTETVQLFIDKETGAVISNMNDTSRSLQST